MEKYIALLRGVNVGGNNKIAMPQLIAAFETQGFSKHNAIFVVPPATAEEVCAGVGEAKPEYERVACHGKVIFWSAPLATFSRTRWSKVTKNKAAYNAVTIRNANTALKLLELAGARNEGV